jgi:hypothetical protein
MKKQLKVIDQVVAEKCNWEEKCTYPSKQYFSYPSEYYFLISKWTIFLIRTSIEKKSRSNPMLVGEMVYGTWRRESRRCLRMSPREVTCRSLSHPCPMMSPGEMTHRVLIHHLMLSWGPPREAATDVASSLSIVTAMSPPPITPMSLEAWA